MDHDKPQASFTSANYRQNEAQGVAVEGPIIRKQKNVFQKQRPNYVRHEPMSQPQESNVLSWDHVRLTEQKKLVEGLKKRLDQQL
jgi:hypothetical protein